jgi:glucose/arabinose dehydrogenase
MAHPFPRRAGRLASLLCGLLVAGPAFAIEPAAGARPGQDPLAPGFFFRVIQRATGLDSPIGIANAGDGTNRLFIIEQGGRIRIWNGTTLLPTPFLDITSIVLSGGEQGLLGLAFHPNYESNGFFYVNYTCRNTAPGCSSGGFGTADSVLARYSVSATNPNVADPASARVMTVIDDPFSNHNGGNLIFGPDSFLYFATGDGGSGDDQCEYAQNTLWDFVSTGGACINTSRANRRTFWGKMLRLDVNQNVNQAPFYGIPATNPYQGANDPNDLVPDEIWAYGLRNPWRFSFDRVTGDLYIGDVGQNSREEVDFMQAPITNGGINFGWDVLEGFLCHENVPAGACNLFLNGGSTLPAFDYPRTDGATVIGGFVYRGRPFSNLITANYIFGDNSSGHVWRARRNGQGQWMPKELLFDTNTGPAGFGEDEAGRLFFAGLFNGSLNQIVPYSFLDVDPTHFSWRFVEALFEAQVTGGCGADNYCPSSTTSRGEMAVFLLRTKLGPAYTPPACANPTFADVPCSNIYAAWIYDLVARGVTSGCGGGLYCPNGPVTREQMAVFLLRTSQGPSYTPPACTAATFADVPCSSPFAPWIYDLVARNVTSGCGGGNFCPTTSVTRAEMAIFLVAMFGLTPV